MGRNLDAKCKQCRRLGEKLFLKGERCNSPKCAMVKRNYPPGFHGQKGKRRQSDYGMQLAEKQKAKKQYNLLEKQFKLTFLKAKRKSGDAGENLLKSLELRLDNAVYRLGFASSRIQARQLVGHGHLQVNGRKVDIPSYEVKEGDIIKIKERSKKYKFFKELPEKLSRQKESIPSWLNLNIAEMAGKVLHEPKAGDIKANVNAQIIVEYYSK
ncbi:MAG: 30S ribosomal protein S4 [Patescibacteria group bacterium]|nr:30S ribosomal protein S4 [Patescibacteria group bacterium]